MPLQHSPTPPVVRARRSAKRPPAANDPVNVTLELLDRHGLAPMELRILFALRDRERSESELARRFGTTRTSLRPSAGALYARGFLRWRYAPDDDDSRFALTPAGKLLLRPLLSL